MTTQSSNNRLANREPKILVLGTADWDQAIATNQHYIVRELLADNPLTYSESLGLRRPELSRRDISRMGRRLFGQGGRHPSVAAVAKRNRPDGLRVVSPVIIPFHTGPARILNKQKIRTLFQDWIKASGPKILWTYTPLTYGLEEFADATIYHCVDLLGEFPGVSASMIRQEEERLARAETTAIGSSKVVEKHLAGAGFRNVLHWPNVADVEAVVRERPSQIERTADRVVFAGNLSKAKVDFELLNKVVDAGLELHLAGPIAEGGGDATSEVRKLVERGVVYHGLLSIPELSKLYWSSSIGLIPYLLTPYTLGVNPLKTFEYLAAGLGVVSTAVPAVRPIDGHVEVIADTADLSRAITNVRGAENDRVASARLVTAMDHSWSNRGHEARALVTKTVNDVAVRSVSSG